MASVKQLREGIQARLDTIDGLRAFDQVKGHVVTPCAWVRPQDVVQQTKDDARDYTFSIDVFVSLNSLRAAQDTLDDYWPGGANDIQDAVEADQTLGGVAGWVTCDPVADSYDFAEIVLGDPRNPMVFLGCQFTVVVGA